MNNEIHLKKILKENNRITYQFDYSESLKKYFNSEEKFFIEYDGFNEVNPPDSILVIPFLCNVLPIAWILDATIFIYEIDKGFYESISNVKKGYIDMYPRLNFVGKIIANKIIDNDVAKSSGKNLMFFSGGVDAFNTLVNHVDENPVLMTLWGTDVSFGDIEGWNNVKNHVMQTAEQFSLDYKLIKSNFRKFINEGELTDLVYNRAKDVWWHGFQHGIGIIGHAAPIAYLLNSTIVYIASTHNVKDVGIVVCASYPTIDNFVIIADTKVSHDGYEFTRQDKIKNICDFVRRNQNNQVRLRVCWQSSGGRNCSNCEKCYRTTMGILAEGYNPNDYGLYYSRKHNTKIKNDIIYKIKMDNMQKTFWRDIQERFLQNPDIFIKYPELKWIVNIDFGHINKNLFKIIYNSILGKKIRRIIYLASYISKPKIALKKIQKRLRIGKMKDAM